MAYWFEEEGSSPSEEKTFQFEEETPEKGSKLTRLAGQYSARGIEGILGLPRETSQFLERLVPKKTLIKGAEKLGLGKGAETLIGLTEKFSPSQLFPTSSQVREGIKTIFGDLFEPHSPTEGKIGEAIQEFASLAFPFGGAIKPSRAFFLASGANATKEIGDWLGYSPSTQEKMKLGFYGLSAFIHPNATKKFYEKNYKEASQLLPENATVSSTNLRKSLNEMEKELKKGGISSADKVALSSIENIRQEMQGAQTPVSSTNLRKSLNEMEKELKKGRISSADKVALSSIKKIRQEIQGAQTRVSSPKLRKSLNKIEKVLKKGGISSANKAALSSIENIRHEIQGTSIPVENLVAAKRKLNIERGNIKKQLEGNKPGIKTANRNIEKVSNALDSTLNEYGQTQNKSWLKHYREANNAFAAAQRSKQAMKNIGKIIPKAGIAHIGLSHLLGHLAGGAIGAAAGAGAAIPMYLVGRTLNRIMRSPPLRREFYRLYEGALKGQTGVMEKSIKKLDKGLGSLERKTPIMEEEEIDLSNTPQQL